MSFVIRSWSMAAGACAAGTLLIMPVALPGRAGAAPAVPRHVHDLQGAAHVSPFNGAQVTRIPGVVIAITANGFWMQGPQPDTDPATSEGIFVFTRTRPAVLPGDAVRVDGRVSEFRPGGAASASLSRTEIDATATTVDAHGVPLPGPVLLGPKGRRPPATVIDDDARGDVETSGRFEPGDDGIDFYESLEGMRIAVDDAVAVGPRSAFGEVPVLAAGGSGAQVRTRRGGIALRAGDGNPERIILDDALTAIPPVNAGDRLAGRTTGVLDYGFGDFKLLPTAAPKVTAAGPARQATRPQRPGELAIASVNLQNLDPGDPPERFEALAGDIVTGLASPDVVTVAELQDNSGPEDDGTVAADQTVAQLVAAISAAGGPAYDWRSIDPANGADGGEPGGNIRSGFLFRTDRGLGFTDRPGGTAADAVAATPVRAGGAADAGLTLSPGRVAPGDPAWADVRKPLAGEFTWQGRQIIVIANHWTARTGDDPLFGRYQPPRGTGKTQRLAQAKVLAGFVKSVRAVAPRAYVVVAGVLNDPDFSPALHALTTGTGLRDLAAELPQPERYTHIAGGNAEVLDHILLSPELARRPYDFEIVHRDAEFADQPTDHDPPIVRLALG